MIRFLLRLWLLGALLGAVLIGYVGGALAAIPGARQTPPQEILLAESAIAALTAMVTAAPPEGAPVSGVVQFEVRGSGMANVELLPATGYTPRWGAFTVTENGALATLSFDTRTLPNGPVQLRISAFDQPPGSVTASEVVAMAPRTWNISNPAPAPFSAALAAGPADGATVGGIVALEVRGSALANVELLPPSGYTQKLGTFTITDNGTVARLNFNTTALPNGPVQLRISAFNKPAGDVTAAEIIAMPARTWVVSNAASAPFSASVTSVPAEGATVNGVVPLEVRGSGIANVELLPPTGYSPKAGVFEIGENGTVARLNFDTRGLPDGLLQLRISAFNRPAGDPTSAEVVAMPPRTWNVKNSTGSTAPAQAVALDGVATIEFPPGALNGQAAQIQKVSSPTFSQLFVDTARTLFGASVQSDYQVVVNLAGGPPALDVKATLIVPPALAALAPPGSELRVYYLMYQGGDEETEVSFDPTPERFPSNSSTVTVAIPPEAFSTEGTQSSVNQAVLALGFSPAPVPGTVSQAGRSAILSQRPVGDRLLAEAGQSAMPADPRATPATLGCFTALVRPVPLKAIMTSKFSAARTINGVTRPHRGIDFAVSNGTQVTAAADGVVTATGDMGSTSWGKYVVVTHENGDRTLYGHLQEASVQLGARVEAGQPIALSDNSGHSTGAHLHLEYIPTGIGNLTGSPKIDPEKCFGAHYVGTFNGDDAGDFSVVISSGGKISGRGKSAALGALTVSGQVGADQALTFSATQGTASTGATFVGSVDPKTGTVRGSWSNALYGASGAFAGQRAH